MSKFGTSKGAVGYGPKPFMAKGGGKSQGGNVSRSASNNAPKGGGHTRSIGGKPAGGKR